MSRLGSRDKGKREKGRANPRVFLVLGFSLSLIPCPLAALWIALWQPRPNPRLRPRSFGRRVRTALQLDYQVQKDFTYLERRRDVRISRLGKVTIGPFRTFEVYPSDRPGGTYKRLIEVDGKPLAVRRAREGRRGARARSARGRLACAIRGREAARRARQSGG